jgi:hypothetical protein
VAGDYQSPRIFYACRINFRDYPHNLIFEPERAAYHDPGGPVSGIIFSCFFADKYIGGKMNKRQQFVELELSGEKLDSLVIGLRNKLLDEFWVHVPEGKYREEIKARLERNIIAAIERSPDDGSR